MGRPEPGASLWERGRTALSRLVIGFWKRFLSWPIARLFHYDLVFRTDTYATLTWAGNPIWQNPLDLWAIQETIFEVRPGLIIETGTNRGGSSLFYAHLMDIIGRGTVVTVDIESMSEVSHERIQYVIGSSTDQEVIAIVRAAVDETEGPVMVILDADHAYEHVKRELEAYAPFVTAGSFLLSQDGVLDQMLLYRGGGQGPLRANQEFLAGHPEFVHDRERTERFSRSSQHPLGWMRRVAEPSAA